MINNDISRFSASVCPVCEHVSGSYAVDVGAYKIVKCYECGLEYTTPTPTAEELRQFYNGYADVRANPEIVVLNAKRNLALLRAYGLEESSSILDFGCGNGEFVEVAGEHCSGVELSKKGPRIFADLEALPLERYDFITLWGVLEHLNEPVQTLKKLIDKLQKKGHLVITTVNAEGTIPYYYKPPEHLTYWTGKALGYLFERNGLELKAIQPYEMCQLSEVYLERLVSRTPEEYREAIASSSCVKLPRILTLPTNEFLAVAELK